MAKANEVEINVMQHLFYDFWKRNKELSPRKKHMLSELVETYKAVIDGIAAKPNAFLVIESGWMLATKRDLAKAKPVKELQEAWERVRDYAAAKMGKRIVVGDILKSPGWPPTNSSLRKEIRSFTKGKNAKVIDCGEYLGRCPKYKAERLIVLLKRAGIKAEYAASRPFGVIHPKLTKKQDLRRKQNIKKGLYPYQGSRMPKPKPLTMKRKARKK